jgi:hypothetical protein
VLTLWNLDVCEMVLLFNFWSGLVQAVHDGVNIFFMLQVDGAYAYSKGYFRLPFVLCLY